DDVAAIGDSLTTYWSSIEDAPIVEAVSGLGDAIPTGGSMPSASFSAFNRTYTFEVPTEVADVVTPVLSAVMYAVWSLLAIRLFVEG
ncbi:hypothetical protein, partial [Solimonas marina]